MKYLLFLSLLLVSCDYNGERVNEVKKRFPKSTIYQDQRYNSQFYIIDSLGMRKISITHNGTIWNTKYLTKIQ